MSRLYHHYTTMFSGKKGRMSLWLNVIRWLWGHQLFEAQTLKQNHFGSSCLKRICRSHCHGFRRFYGWGRWAPSEPQWKVGPQQRGPKEVLWQALLGCNACQIRAILRESVGGGGEAREAGSHREEAESSDSSDRWVWDGHGFAVWWAALRHRLQQGAGWMAGGQQGLYGLAWREPLDSQGPNSTWPRSIWIQVCDFQFRKHQVGGWLQSQGPGGQFQNPGCLEPLMGQH